MTNTCARIRWTVALFALLASSAWAQPQKVSGPQPSRPSANPLADSRQLLLVVTDGWDGVDGALQRYERPSPDARWTPVGAPAAVVVGRAGLAWGRGLADVRPAGGPMKREGDNKGPAGVFRLGMAFGEPVQRPAGWTVPYRSLGERLECVDDARSAYYNRVTTREEAPQADWTSSEHMWRVRDYRWGIVVEHNAPEPKPGAGSCIFLHLWEGPGKGTEGCTAMDEGALQDVLGWLDAARHPLLVQLPRAEYRRLAGAWGLPPAR